MKNCASKKLIRFIRNPDHFNIFNYETNKETDSTFIMRPLSFYREIEDGRIRDAGELHVQLWINNKFTDHEDIQPEYIYVSCWSIFDNINISTLASRFLMDNNTLNGVAIISNVNKVDKLIRRATSIYTQPSNRYEHRAVTYYDNSSRLNIDSNLVNRTIRFMKERNDFEVEQEYRFVFDAIALQNIENTLIFDIRAEDYIDKIISFGHVNFELSNYCANRGIACDNFTG